MLETIMQVLSYADEALVAILAIVGGLKVFARYTKWTWDDKALETVERVAKTALSIFKKAKSDEQPKE